MKHERKETILLAIAGVIPVTWLDLKLAPYLDIGLFKAFEQLDKIFEEPVNYPPPKGSGFP